MISLAYLAFILQYSAVYSSTPTSCRLPLPELPTAPCSAQPVSLGRSLYLTQAFCCSPTPLPSLPTTLPPSSATPQPTLSLSLSKGHHSALQPSFTATS